MENAAKRTIHRVDSWTPEQDRQLAEIVLRNMREGRTQLSAFVEAAEALGRTPSACGVRWNVVVRKQYEDRVQEAKRFKRERWTSHENQHVRRRKAAAKTLDSTLRSLRAQEQACLRLERQIAEMSEAVSGAVARIRQEIQALEAERRRFEEQDAMKGAQTEVLPCP